jgi:cellulose-binding protein
MKPRGLRYYLKLWGLSVSWIVPLCFTQQSISSESPVLTNVRAPIAEIVEAGKSKQPGTNASANSGALAGRRYRVVVSTDIGGTDPDDFQSMVHLLVYADCFDIEGLVSSPYGPGRKKHILEVIDCYAKDYANLKTYSDKYPAPNVLRAITKQGETERAPYAGVRRSTEGSKWIVECARRDDPRPLYVLVWGGIEDLAQALHDAPDILPKLRVYWIGGPNKKWGPDVFQYLATHHPNLWIIEANATYRGWFTGGNQSGQWGNEEFVKQHIAGKGTLGDFFVSKKSDIKMGDTPSVGWLLKGTPDDPSQPGWGGRFVRAWKRPYNRLERMTTKEDRIEVFGILELVLLIGNNIPEQPESVLAVENQRLPGYAAGDGTMRFRFCPKVAKAYNFTIRGNVPALDGKTGGITAFVPPPEVARRPSSQLPNWWTDDPSEDVAEGQHIGAKTVSRWREDFLRDFAARMIRCQSPVSPNPTNRSITTSKATSLATVPTGAAPLRVDINSEERADMRTVGWENWQPSGGDMSQSFSDVTVTLCAGGNGGSVSLSGNKRLVVHGVTVGADGAVATGGNPAVMEVRLEGLAPGPHTFVGYHHALGGADGIYAVSTGNRKVEGIKTSQEPRHNDEVGTSFIEFEAKAGQPVVIRIAAASGDRVLLNGFAIDVTDPRKKALKPMPADYERHTDGDDGKMKLTWTPSGSVVNHHVYMVFDRDPGAAERKLTAATKDSEGFLASVKGDSYSTTIVANNSLLHYAWRVDSVDAKGKVTCGDVWHFRVRHLAFPTAEGYGRFAIGGRGGRVMHVTNLNDSGPGSLREAVEATGPRTVVFDVSGLISLKSKLVFRGKNEFLTIAGQTAPGKGICIRNYTFGGLGACDTVVRFIRLRLGNLTGKTMDGMGLASSDHCIVDHCSISWTIDEAFSSRGAKNITFQRNLISEALNIAGHKKYGAGSAHGYAGSISGNVGSFHHSLLAHNAGRNWSLAGAIDQANRHAGRLDIRNMVVYNWSHRTTDGGAMQVNFVNNYYKPGPASKVKTYLNPQFENSAFGPQQYYVEGNIMEGVAGPEGPTGMFRGMNVRGQQDAPVTVPEPFFEHHVKTHTAKEAFENVLADVGCNVPRLDDHDKRVIEETRAGTTTYKGSKSGLPGLPDTQEDVGGWEDYPEIRRPASWDTDGDGMPDKWEIEKALNTNDPADGAADPDGDGYTNLEDYLNWLAEDKTLS